MKIKIRDLNLTGDGIGANEDGKIFFVENALPTEVIDCDILDDKNAKVRSYIKKSKDRINPPCPVFQDCGGCHLQHLNYEATLKFKENRVLSCLERIAGLDRDFLEKINIKIKPSPEIWRYRNNVQFKIKRESGKIKIGFLKSNTHEIIDQSNSGCLITSKSAEQIRDEFLSFVNQKNHETLPKVLQVRNSNKTKQTLVNLIFDFSSDEEKAEEFGNAFSEFIKNKHENISINIRTGKKPQKITNILGEEYFVDEINNKKFLIESTAFFQVNTSMVEFLQKELISIFERNNITLPKVVYDIYGGTGSLGSVYAEQGATVKVFEINETAKNYGLKQAQLNGLADKFEYFLGDANKTVPENLKHLKKPDLIITDPPRKGLTKKLIENLAKTNCKNWIYLSCDPATLARDLKTILSLGYNILSVQALDMFPWTTNVETVALLSKLDVDKHIDVEIELDELDLTSAESKATYAQIKEYVWNKFELKVPTLYIAQIKRKCGIELREHYNKSKKEKQIIPQCTPEKEEAIMDALRHFKMI